MSDKSSILRGFNSHFMEFLNDLITIYPDNQDIMSAKVSFENIKKMNPTIIIKAWYSHVYFPYKAVIDQGDISFFFDKDYSNDLSDINNSEDLLKVIEKVREPIRNMDEVNKKHASQYLKNLSKLSSIYSGL
jgi:hypothetical protein